MPKYIDVDSSAYDYGTLVDWLISSVGPEPPVWTEPHIEELLEDFYVVPKSTPLADVVEVRHGRWLSKEYMYGDPDVGVEDGWVERLAEQSDYYAYCSVCGKDAEYNGEGSLVLSDYCPSCGAKMDGGHDD